MRIATIDIGTNSVLLLIVEHNPPKPLKRLREQATITRLGQGVDHTGQLHPEAIQRTLQCLQTYAKEAQAWGVERTLAVGTSALRDARGADVFLDAAEHVLTTRPRVISGEEEARLTFTGALSGLSLPAGPVTVFDVGGGSTEVVTGIGSEQAPQLASAHSLNIGSVRLTERYFQNDPPSPEQIQALRAHVQAELAKVSKAPREAIGVGVAGTITTLAAIAHHVHPYDSARIHGSKLSVAQLAEVTCRLASMSLKDRSQVDGLDAGRADVIVAGAVLVEQLLAWHQAPFLVVSDRGVRWGVALEAVADQNAKRS